MAWNGLDDFIGRARLRLDPIEGKARLPEGGDGDYLSGDELDGIRPAAVLIGISPRETGATALLTQRPKTMPTHAGQVAFPGGKLDPVDKDEVEAALREAEEEVGVGEGDVELIGRASPYLTGTGYRIVPVVGLLRSDFVPIPDKTEVDAVFESEMSFLMNPDNHTTNEAIYKGKRRVFYDMPYEGFRIWGVTAGIIRRLYVTLYGGD